MLDSHSPASKDSADASVDTSDAPVKELSEFPQPSSTLVLESLQQLVQCDSNNAGRSHIGPASQIVFEFGNRNEISTGKTDSGAFLDVFQDGALHAVNVSPSHTNDGENTSAIYERGIAPTWNATCLTRPVEYSRHQDNGIPLESLFGPKVTVQRGPYMSASREEKFERLLARLIQFEAHEPNPSYRQDYRQAQIWISLAAKPSGTEKTEREAFIQSAYICYGLHPDNVFRQIQRDRHEKLGKEYGRWYRDDGTLLPDVAAAVPKKPAEPIIERICGIALPHKSKTEEIA